MKALVLGRYDAAAISAVFAQEGVLDAVARKGFANAAVSVEDNGAMPPAVRLQAEKDGQTHLLFECRLTELVVPRACTAGCGATPARDISLGLVFWAREQDPTERFSDDRPQLPLQAYPGLGILRRVFRAGARMAAESGKDGLANMPKFPHDALIFCHSLGFLFLDAREQGRMEALWRDLGHLGLRDLSLAMIGQSVRDARGYVASWSPGLQVHPVGAVLADYVNSDAYARARAEALASARYTVELPPLRAAVDMFEASLRS
jgi:hypothetical protein